MALVFFIQICYGVLSGTIYLDKAYAPNPPYIMLARSGFKNIFSGIELFKRVTCRL